MAEVQDNTGAPSPELDHLTNNEDDEDEISTEEESNVTGEAKKHKKKKKVGSACDLRATGGQIK